MQMQYTEEILIIFLPREIRISFLAFHSFKELQERGLVLTKQLCDSVTIWSPAVTGDCQIFQKEKKLSEDSFQNLCLNSWRFGEKLEMMTQSVDSII